MHIDGKQTPLNLYIRGRGINMLRVWSMMDFTVAWNY